MATTRTSAQAQPARTIASGRGRGGPARHSGAGAGPVGIRRRLAAWRAPRKMEFEAEGRPEMVAQFRTRVGEFAEMMHFAPGKVADIKLAVGEAVTNAVQHASQDGTCRVRMKAEKHRDGMRIRISDKGCGFDPVGVAQAACTLEEHGRGIACMKAVMDEVHIRSSRKGTDVTLFKKLK